MSLKEIVENNKSYYSHIGKLSSDKISYLLEKNSQIDSGKTELNFINNLVSKGRNKEKTDIQYDSDNDNIFSKDYDNRHNLDIQEQKLKYFSNYRNPCTYIENKVKKENKNEKNKNVKNENEKKTEDKNKIKAKKELQKIMDSGFNFSYYHHLFHHTSDANFYSENKKNEIILGPDINATRYNPNLEYIYPKTIYSPSFKLMDGRYDKELLIEKLKKELELKIKKNKENEKQLETIKNNIKSKTQYKNPKLHYKKLNKNKGNIFNENNTNTKEYTKYNKSGSNNNDTVFTSNAIKNESNTVNSNTISNNIINSKTVSNNNIILDNEIITGKLSNYYRDLKTNKNYRKINLVGGNKFPNLFQKKQTKSSSVANIYKNSKIKNLSFRQNKASKSSNKDNNEKDKSKKENSFQLKGPNFHKMIGRKYLSKLKNIEEPIHPQINPNWNVIQPKCIMKIDYSYSPIQKKKINEFQGLGDEATFNIDKLYNNYNNHFPAKSIYFNKMTGRTNNKIKNSLPFYMMNLCNRHSCNNFNEKSLKMNNFFEGRFKEPISTFNRQKSFNYKLKMNIENEKNLNLSTEEKNNKNNAFNLFMKIFENNNNKTKRKKIAIPKQDFMSITYKNKIIDRLSEFYKMNLDTIQPINKIDGITFKSYRKYSKDNNILNSKEKKIFSINFNKSC